MRRSILPPHGGDPAEVLRRPRDAPRGDDRLLRAPLVRAAALPLARAARHSPTRRSRGSFFVRELQRTFPSTSLDSILNAVQRDPGERRPRSASSAARLPALVVALALQRARERLQHRLRPAEPPLPARQGARDDDDGRLARRRCSCSLVIGSIGVELLKRYARLAATTSVLAYVVSIGGLGCSASSSSSRPPTYVLTNDALDAGARCSPGAVVGGGRCSRRRSRCCRCSSASRSTTRCCRPSPARPCCSSGST